MEEKKKKKRKRENHVQFCSAPNCSNKRKPKTDGDLTGPTLSFHRFPKPRDEERSKQWAINCRREDLRRKTPQQLYASNVLCGDHFEDSQYKNPTTRSGRLIANAVPTIFNIPNPPPQLSSTRPNSATEERRIIHERTAETSHSTDSKDQEVAQAAVDDMTERSETTCSLRIRALKRKVRSQQSKLYRLRKKVKTLNKDRGQEKARSKQKEKVELITQLARFLNGPALKFVTAQIRQGKKRPNGMRWKKDDKALALTLYRSSPRTYRLLRNIFSLPSVTTLKEEMKKINVQPGFNNK